MSEKEKKKKKENEKRKRKSLTYVVRHRGEATVSQAQVSHLSGVTEGLRHSEGAQGEATNAKESLERGFYIPEKKR